MKEEEAFHFLVSVGPPKISFLLSAYKKNYYGSLEVAAAAQCAHYLLIISVARPPPPLLDPFSKVRAES